MSSTRTQIYLTRDQRKRLDELRRRESKTLAQLVREAIDAYLGTKQVDVDDALKASFGTMPDLEVPSRDEWERGEPSR
jgi:predicted DNA-binding protein